MFILIISESLSTKFKKVFHHVILLLKCLNHSKYLVTIHNNSIVEKQHRLRWHESHCRKAMSGIHNEPLNHLSPALPKSKEQAVCLQFPRSPLRFAL